MTNLNLWENIGHGTARQLENGTISVVVDTLHPPSAGRLGQVKLIFSHFGTLIVSFLVILQARWCTLNKIIAAVNYKPQHPSKWHLLRRLLPNTSELYHCVWSLMFNLLERRSALPPAELSSTSSTSSSVSYPLAFLIPTIDCLRIFSNLAFMAGRRNRQWFDSGTLEADKVLTLSFLIEFFLQR